MKQDGGLRKLFRKHLPHVHWTSIESRFTESGIPDLNGCTASVEFWLECKVTKGWTIRLRPMQIAWILRHQRSGGHVFVAVRRQSRSGDDELWLVYGHSIRQLARCGLPCGLMWAGGPSRWDWPAVLKVLKK